MLAASPGDGSTLSDLTLDSDSDSYSIDSRRKPRIRYSLASPDAITYDRPICAE
jgi:hypothetical protein